MAFSGTLPKVVYDVGPGGAFATNQNALSRNQILAAQAQYAPQQAQANAYLTAQQARFLPYQQMMSILGNPMAWMAAKDNPEMLQKLTNMMSSLPNVSGDMSQWPLPSPQSQNNGLLGQLKGALTNALGIGSSTPNQGIQPSVQPNNALLASPSLMGMNNQNQPMGHAQGSPLVPATQGGMGGVLGAMTAPYTQSPYKAPFVDPNNPGHIIYPLTTPTSTAIQTQLLGQRRVEPQIERLADEWAPFMDVKGMSDLTKGRIGQAFGRVISPESLKSVGLSPNDTLSSQYAKAEATIKVAPEALVKAYGLRPTNETLARLETAVRPIWGESADSYKERMYKTVEELKNEQEAPSKEFMQKGFSSAPSNVGKNEPVNSSEMKPGDISKVQGYKTINGVSYVKTNGKWHEWH